MSKARIAEIFTAVSGIITEGANLSRQGVKIADHPLVALADDGAMKLWDAKYAAINRPLSSKGDQEHIVRPLIQFLAKASPVLCNHVLVGKVALVSEHVREILAGEMSADPRAPEKFKEGGGLAHPFEAPYSSGAIAKAKEKAASKQAADDMEDQALSDMGAPAVAAAASRRGRPPASRQPAFA